MRCKKGDLAEVIKSIDGMSVGKFVEVVEFAGFHPDHGPTWLVESRTSDLVTEYGGVGRRQHAADDWLKPVPPGAPKLKTKELETT